ncbi:glycoside hydrolase family 2 protein [Saccharibacillus sacchari]|uniref:Glycoside hydrolase family 2 TIM barrel-domain containing protein n=1 Tax=Saccharibacillus sacchari TaxID=456493 RepID=A0ACC6PE32_9BACL
MKRKTERTMPETEQGAEKRTEKGLRKRSGKQAFRDALCLNGEWDFMPLYDRPQELSLPKSAAYEKRKVSVPSSWRGSYESRPGYTFGRIEAYGFELFAPYGYPPEWDRAEAGLLRRSFVVPQEWEDRRILLRLDGVMQQAAVYVNGQKLAVWRDGYLPLRLDLTSLVRPGETCELQVICANFDKTAIASGAVKSTGLTGSWFGYLARGLWQDVWLESIPHAAVESVSVRTSVRENRLEIDASVGGSAELRLAGRLSVGESAGLPSADTLSVRLNVRRADRPDKAPVLTAEIGLGARLGDESGIGSGIDSGTELEKDSVIEFGRASGMYSVIKSGVDSGIDSKTKAEIKTDTFYSCCANDASSYGFSRTERGGGSEEERESRLCENEWRPPIGTARFRLDWRDAELWSPDSPVLYTAELELLHDGIAVDRIVETFGFREFWIDGPTFMLNGIPLSLRGDSWHFQGPTQQTEAYVRAWYGMCREVGVNCIRLHAEPYPEYFLRIADEMGMLIIGETAIYGSGKSMAADHPDYIRNALDHVQRLVRRDRNHPSVVMWSVENEMRWVDGRDAFKRQIPALMENMRRLDPTRPIVAEGDNRLLPKALTEAESRHYNIDGTIAQWDRSVPLTFGEHGSWWYICPQNASVYAGLKAYRHTNEAVKGLAEKERLFVEYARRQGVSGISTFNFAHYFMRAMPEQNILLEWADPTAPGVKPAYIPAYSLTLNNGLLPPEYPLYRPNPAFAVMREAFRPAALIAAQYDRCFFDDAPIVRSFDVYNDTLVARDVTVEFAVAQGGRELRRERLEFRQLPAEKKVAAFEWRPEPVGSVAEDAKTEYVATDSKERAVAKELNATELKEEAIELTAVLYHDGRNVHEVRKTYRLFSAVLKSSPLNLRSSCLYVGGEDDYALLRSLVPGCRRISASGIGEQDAAALLVVGSSIRDEDGAIERGIGTFAARGGRVLLLEQESFSIGLLTLSRRDFIRAHAASYDHPILDGFGDDDLMFWEPELREAGPVPLCTAAYEKPAAGDYRLLLESSAGDFGDGGDLWTPLLEYRGGGGYLLANQLGLTSRFARVPQACVLLRRLLAHADRAESAALADARPQGTAAGSAAARFLGAPDGAGARLLAALRLPHRPLRGSREAAHAVSASPPQPPDPALLLIEPDELLRSGVPEAARAFAEAGGAVVVLPCLPKHGEALARLLGRRVGIAAREAYQLEADYAYPLAAGLSPADLFGLDKVHHSPRDVENLPLGLHRIEADGGRPICVSVEGTAWKDYFVHKHTAEHSRLALVELNRDRAQPPGTFVAEFPVGAGRIICSQIILRPELDKNVRLYARLLANLGAAFDDDLWSSVKSDAQHAIESMMALPCEPYQDEQAMRAYYTDPDFSLNNLGEGLYGWMKKKERHPQDGTMRIADSAGGLWFLSAFVELPAVQLRDSTPRSVRFRTSGNPASVELWLNGRPLESPLFRSQLRPGLNRLIAIVRGGAEDIRLAVFVEHPDGTPMNDLRYNMTIDEVTPK